MIRFSLVDADSEKSAYQWHSAFAAANESIYLRTRGEFKALVEHGIVCCATDVRGNYVGMIYAYISDGAWEIGGLAVAATVREKGIGLVLAYLILGHVLFLETPLADEPPPRPMPIVAKVLTRNQRPRRIIQGILGFRLSKPVRRLGVELPGLPPDPDGYVNGDEFMIVVPETLIALAEWAEEWKDRLPNNQAARIELGGPDVTLAKWAMAFREMAEHVPAFRSEESMADEPSRGMAKLHALIFSLLFPGVLAAFILTQFTEEARLEGFSPWAWVLCLYFAVQFVEGHETKANYRIDRAVVNLLETAIMVLIFAALGYFPDLKVGGQLVSPGAIKALMAAVFALPAVYRLALAPSTLQKGHTGYLFARSLTVMSLLAAGFSGFFATEAWAWASVLILLLVYMVAFQFCNDWVVDRLSSPKRPWIEEFRRPG